MTFIPSTNSTISTLNSTSSTLTASSEFLGTSEDVSRYSTVLITVSSDVASDSLGVKFEFSVDNSLWDIITAFTYNGRQASKSYKVDVTGKYLRIRYTNGSTGQTLFHLQTKLQINDKSSYEVSNLPIDAFGRVRTSEPLTLLSNNHITGKHSYIIYEDITGSATSVYDADAANIEMSTTGVGTVIRRHRTRATYQPGKSLLVYMTGVLNDGTNASTVTTKLGYYDDDDGYFFQFNNGTISVVERSSVTGSVVNTVVNQDDWNINNMDGTVNENFDLDLTKANIFWFNMEWLGVGFVDCGLVIDGCITRLHRFSHANLLGSAYISTASLPPTYEIISTGGSGSMRSMCYTVFSEGGFIPIGTEFSANMGITTKSVSSIEPLIVIRIKSGSKINVDLLNISVISTSGANMLIELYKFVDTTAGSILNDTTFISANSESGIEYNVAATTITVTNGLLFDSGYFSNNNDSLTFTNSENGRMGTSAGTSDLLAVCATSIGAAENIIASITWLESV